MIPEVMNMQRDAFEEQDGYVLPRNETEKKIARIWEKILKLERVGMRDNFLDLGGDSLHAIRVMNEIRIGWSIELSIEQIHEYPTVESLAVIVDRMSASVSQEAGRAG
jgi:polyketide synthase PksJ